MSDMYTYNKHNYFYTVRAKFGDCNNVQFSSSTPSSLQKKLVISEPTPWNSYVAVLSLTSIGFNSSTLHTSTSANERHNNLVFYFAAFYVDIHSDCTLTPHW